MPQIYIMLAVTLAISCLLWGGLLYLFTHHETRYFWLLLLGLPLSAVANLLIKRQAILTVANLGQVDLNSGLAAPAWFLGFQVLLTPLVEELIKIAPLLLLPAWRLVKNGGNALWVGFVLGVTFGLGEAMLIAYAVERSGQYATLPWYAFTGFLNERIMTCFAHGVMTAVLVIGLQRGSMYILKGYMYAVSVHLFLNGPVALYQLRWISNELYGVALIIPFIVLALMFERMRRAVRGPNDDQTAQEVVYWRRPTGGQFPHG